MVRCIEIGDRYGEADDNRERRIRVNGVDVVLWENYWKGRNVWQLTLDITPFRSCNTKKEVWTEVADLVRIMKALEFYEYYLHTTQSDGTLIWEVSAR